MQKVSVMAAMTVVGLSACLLIGRNFEFTWAGGTGPITDCPASLASNDSPADNSITRGEIMATGADRLKYQLCDGTTLYLDNNTEVRLTAYQNTAPTQLELIQGRMLVDGVADVRARQTTVRIAGAGCELVHYSWKDELDVTPLVESGCKILNTNTIPDAQRTTRLNTFDASLKIIQPFSPESSSASDFYTWTGLSL